MQYYTITITMFDQHTQTNGLEEIHDDTVIQSTEVGVLLSGIILRPYSTTTMIYQKAKQLSLYLKPIKGKRDTKWKRISLDKNWEIILTIYKLQRYVRHEDNNTTDGNFITNSQQPIGVTLGIISKKQKAKYQAKLD